MKHTENILSIVNGATEQQRLVIVHRSLEPRDEFRVGPIRLYHTEEMRDANSAAPSAPTSRPFCEQIQAIRDRPIVLRQESFSPAVGWFAQSEMELTHDQWNGMRATLVPSGLSGRGRESVVSRRETKRLQSSTSARRPRSVSRDGDVIALPLHADQAVPA